MIIVGGRTRSAGGRSHWSAPGVPGSLGRAWRARRAGQEPPPERPSGPVRRPLATARYRDLRVVLTCDHERP